MSRAVQQRMGTTDELDAFTGVIGEVVYDDQNNELRSHDGEKQGGYTFLTELGVVARILNTTSDAVVYTTNLGKPLQGVTHLLEQGTTNVWALDSAVPAGVTLASFTAPSITGSDGNTYVTTPKSLATAGSTGAQGAQGEQGDPGAPGADGQDGQDGAQGTSGVDGQDGAQGAQGQAGAQGTTGAQGASGQDGGSGLNESLKYELTPVMDYSLYGASVIADATLPDGGKFHVAAGDDPGDSKIGRKYNFTPAQVINYTGKTVHFMVLMEASPNIFNDIGFAMSYESSNNAGTFANQSFTELDSTHWLHEWDYTFAGGETDVTMEMEVNTYYSRVFDRDFWSIGNYYTLGGVNGANEAFKQMLAEQVPATEDTLDTSLKVAQEPLLSYTVADGATWVNNTDLNDGGVSIPSGDLGIGTDVSQRFHFSIDEEVLYTDRTLDFYLLLRTSPDLTDSVSFTLTTDVAAGSGPSTAVLNTPTIEKLSSTLALIHMTGTLSGVETQIRVKYVVAGNTDIGSVQTYSLIEAYYGAKDLRGSNDAFRTLVASLGVGAQGAQGAQGDTGATGADGGTSIVFAGRQGALIGLADSAATLSRTNSPTLPGTAIVTSAGVTATTVPLVANTAYRGYAEVTLFSSNDDISEAELAVIDSTNMAGSTVVALAEKAPTTGTFRRVTLRAEFIIRPLINISVTLRFGYKGTGISIPAQQSSNGDSYLTFYVEEIG